MARERLVGREFGAGDGGQASRAERNLRAQLGLLAELPAEVPPNHRPTLDQNDDDDDADDAAGFCAGSVRTVRLMRGRDFFPPST